VLTLLHNLFWIVFAIPVITGNLPPGDQLDQNILKTPAGEPINVTPLDCNCSITQDGSTYPISALLGNVSASAFYSYNNPNASSANTGLELNNGLILFLYEDINTGIVSLFLITDIANSGTGGTMEFEANCLPPAAYVSVQDDAGEFNGAPPLITGNWGWGACCTDGGVIEDIGCSNTLNLDLLVSSGIDSIVWYTGDLTMPDMILLSMNGEAITINCGGGVCCPVDFDTEVAVTNATCPDSPNGAIDITPHDGIPPYTYDWSNGESTQDISDLLPDIYMVTITDSQGCTEELQMTVDISPGDPMAQPAGINLCSENTEDVFDLTSIENIINLGAGFNVLWFVNIDLTSPITTPSNYLSGSTTIYAVVDNGSCLSDPVPVQLVIIPSPIPTAITFNQCEENNEMTSFDLTTLDGIVSGGSGIVSWYLDSDLNNPVPDPSAFASGSGTIYATVDDGTCTSDPVEIELIVDLKPIGYPSGMELCGDTNNEAVFDLTLLDLAVSAGNGSVDWFLEIELLDPITSPGAFQTASTIVYAVVFDGICNSDPVPVDLIINPTPVGMPITIIGCDNGADMAWFNLWDYAMLVSGGAGDVNWYLDEFLIDAIPNPGAFLTESTVLFATVDNGICVSEIVQITLNVIQSPVGNPTTVETCADSSGQGTFNLILADPEVSGGEGTVQWYEDAQGLIPVTSPASFVTTGTTVFAQINANGCLSGFIPVTLMIIQSVTATSAQYESCNDGNNLALFNLVTIESIVSGGSGIVSWYLDSAGTNLITNPDSFPSMDRTVYAIVSAGTCVSDIVDINLIVLPSPQATSISPSFCGNLAGETIVNLTSQDMMLSGNTGNVLWYADSLLTISVTNPTSLLTGDTTLYATVSNGVCIAGPVAVTISVTTALVAYPVELTYCIPMGDTLLIDLTESDSLVGGTTNPVHWYYTPSISDEISNVTLFPLASNDTLYALTTDGICFSEIVAIELATLIPPVSNSLAIDYCGDANGEVTLDLTSVDALVSNNSGTVQWFVDSGMSILLTNPGTFLTMDTIVYATVTNGNCISPVVPVIVTVVDSLTANPLDLEICIVDDDTAVINLTLSDIAVSGGSGPVFWFTDSLGIDTLTSATTFTTTGDTLYALVAADGCFSNLAQISIEVESSYTPLLTCEFSSIDSLAVSWLPVAAAYELDYAINGLFIATNLSTTQNEFGLGGLSQGDTLTLWVTAIFNSICTMPLTTSITCITETCPPQTLAFPGLNTVFCKDVPFVVIHATPPGGQLTGEGISGDTLYPVLISGLNTSILYTWVDNSTGCAFDLSTQIELIDPPSLPVLDCQSVSLHAVQFDWPLTATQFGYQYVVNQGATSETILTSTSTLLIDNLQEGDSVTFQLWSIGTAPCKNSDTVSITCRTKQCPPATLAIVNPGFICSDDVPIQLEITLFGIIGTPTIMWSGPGIIDPDGIFDPGLGMVGLNNISVTVDNEGCIYMDSTNLGILETPLSMFKITGVPCIDSALHVQFSGEVYASSLFGWDLSGGEIISGSLPVDFSVQWYTPGDYTMSLYIDYLGCTSDTFTVPVQIDEPLGIPQIICLEEDYYSLVVEWEPVIGADQYHVTTSLGNGKVSGNTCMITNLPDGIPVTITVEAMGSTACGPSSATIECETLDYIPPQSYIPNIFSPNGDGINELFFVQSNAEITLVNLIRIYDRWGELIYSASGFVPNDPQYGWDGTMAGKPMNPAVYTYFAELQTVYGKTIVVSGDVTLMR
jgi:gliding motility-associated-like protein